MKTSEIIDLLPALESLDTYTALSAQGEVVQTPYHTSLLFADGIHPSDAGHAILADLYEAAIPSL